MFYLFKILFNFFFEIFSSNKKIYEVFPSFIFKPKILPFFSPQFHIFSLRFFLSKKKIRNQNEMKKKETLISIKFKCISCTLVYLQSTYTNPGMVYHILCKQNNPDDNYDHQQQDIFHPKVFHI